MIETQFIKQNGKPVAAIIDYDYYLEFIEYIENKEALEAVKEMENNNWLEHQQVKKELGL